MKGRLLMPGEIPDEAMERIMSWIGSIRNGRVTLSAQDGRLVSVGREEHLTVSELLTGSPASSPPAKDETDRLRRGIRQAFLRLEYGQVTIILKNGSAAQIERLVKSRFTGIGGEGI